MKRWGVRLGNIIILLLAGNLTMLLKLLHVSWWISFPAALAAVLLFLAVNILPFWRIPSGRWDVLRDGRELAVMALYFWPLAAGLQAWYGSRVFSTGSGQASFFVNLAFCLLAGVVLLWNGLVRMMALSRQLTVACKAAMALLCWCPVVNLVLLYRFCHTVRLEVEQETEKEELNQVRQESELCKTKYPILLVHGVFFRDLKYWNYWGRIPRELIRNGAAVYYGNQQSAASVADSAAELAERIRQILAETGAEKVNIIAHSKGGLDARYAIGRLGMVSQVASLTTINTPHRGCAFADFLLQKLPDSLCRGVARRYNAALKRFGDHDPDFLSAVQDLTQARCRVLNEELPDQPGVFYQSTASRMKGWYSAPFPLCFSYLLAGRFDRFNDGLVGMESAKWGSLCLTPEPAGRRGISHGDMIDLFRKNIRGFDVREFYVRLAAGLKQRGL